MGWIKDGNEAIAKLEDNVPSSRSRDKRAGKICTQYRVVGTCRRLERPRRKLTLMGQLSRFANVTNDCKSMGYQAASDNGARAWRRRRKYRGILLNVLAERLKMKERGITGKMESGFAQIAIVVPDNGWHFEGNECELMRWFSGPLWKIFLNL